jgi:DNA-binding NarL/FixJ family response regulator
LRSGRKAEADSKMKTDDPAGGAPLRVLLVEDEVVVAMTLRVQLEALGCQVVGTARDANSGVDMAEALRPDLVLMDIGLRGKSGVEATQEIMGIAPTKVIVVTAYGDHRVQQALEAGAQLVLMKPVLEEQLAQAITAVTGREVGRASKEDGGEP